MFVIVLLILLAASDAFPLLVRLVGVFESDSVYNLSSFEADFFSELPMALLYATNDDLR